MNKVTSDTVIADVLKMNNGAAVIFLNNGLHCIGCPSAQGETIEEACAVHGIDTNKILKELNDYLASK